MPKDIFETKKQTQSKIILKNHEKRNLLNTQLLSQDIS